eukprot:753945-Hanusia_phi.AAC.5
MAPRIWQRKLQNLGLGAHFCLFYLRASDMIDSFDDGSIDLPLPLHELVPWAGVKPEQQVPGQGER